MGSNYWTYPQKPQVDINRQFLDSLAQCTNKGTLSLGAQQDVQGPKSVSQASVSGLLRCRCMVSSCFLGVTRLGNNPKILLFRPVRSLTWGCLDLWALNVPLRRHEAAGIHACPLHLLLLCTSSALHSSGFWGKAKLSDCALNPNYSSHSVWNPDKPRGLAQPREIRCNIWQVWESQTLLTYL